VSLTLLFCFASPFARAAASADGDWPRTLLAGALGVLTLLLAAVSALALLPSPLSVPIAILFAGVAVVAKVFGMGALFLLLGQKLLRASRPASGRRHWPRGSRPWERFRFCRSSARSSGARRPSSPWGSPSCPALARRYRVALAA
jgi:hypothetical protein